MMSVDRYSYKGSLPVSTERENTEKQQLELYFGNYRLFQVIKRNSLSTVYRGEHVHLGSSAIVKVLNSWSATEEHIHQFCAEARLHASLRHTNVIRVLDFGIRGRTPFIIMDYAARGTLQDYLPTGVPLPLTTIVPYVRQIANALQYVHNRNLIHRDVKAQNVLLGPSDEVWLSDFGIAVATQPCEQQQAQPSVGTAQYVAPEQIEGHPLTASDQYALAVQTYTWLAGRPPFIGSSMQLCKQHLYTTPPRLRELVPALPAHVEAVVMRGLEKDPYQRFSCISDFAHALHLAAYEHASEPALSAFSERSWSAMIPAFSAGEESSFWSSGA